MDHIMGYETNMFSDHSAIKLKISDKCLENLNIWKLNDSLVNYQWAKGEIRRKIKF